MMQIVHRVLLGRFSNIRPLISIRYRQNRPQWGNGCGGEYAEGGQIIESRLLGQIGTQLTEQQIQTIKAQCCLALRAARARMASLAARKRRESAVPRSMAAAPQEKKRTMRASMVKMQAMVMAQRRRDSGMTCSRSWQYSREPFYSRSTPARKQRQQRQPSVRALSTHPTTACPNTTPHSPSCSPLAYRQLPIASITQTRNYYSWCYIYQISRITSQPLHLAPQIRQQLLAAHLFEGLAADHQFVDHVVDHAGGEDQFLDALLGQRGHEALEQLAAAALYQLDGVVELAAQLLAQLPQQHAHLRQLALHKPDEAAHHAVLAAHLALLPHRLQDRCQLAVHAAHDEEGERERLWLLVDGEADGQREDVDAFLVVLDEDVLLEVLAEGALGGVGAAQLAVGCGDAWVVDQFRALLTRHARGGVEVLRGGKGVGVGGLGERERALEVVLGRALADGRAHQRAVADLVGEDLAPVGPQRRVLGDHAADELGDLRRDLRLLRDHDVLLLDDHDQLPDVVALEGAEPVEHAEQHHAQRPDVGLDAVGLALQDLGRHVDRRAEHRLRDLVLVLQRFAEAEVCEFDDAVVEEEVFGLEVAVHDVVAVEDLEGLDDLREVGEGDAFGEDALVLEEFLEGAAVAELVDEVEVVDGFEHVEVLDDVRAGLEVREDVDLVVGALLQLRVLLELLRLHHLDRHLLLVLYVDRLVHCRVHPPPDLALQRVVLDHLTHLSKPIQIKCRSAFYSLIRQKKDLDWVRRGGEQRGRRGSGPEECGRWQKRKEQRECLALDVWCNGQHIGL